MNERMGIIMDIFVGILALIVVAAGVWGWWLERGNSSDNDIDNNKTS